MELIVTLIVGILLGLLISKRTIKIHHIYEQVVPEFKQTEEEVQNEKEIKEMYKAQKEILESVNKEFLGLEGMYDEENKN